MKALKIYYIVLIIYIAVFTFFSLGFGPIVIVTYSLDSLVVAVVLFLLTLLSARARRHKKQIFIFLLTFILAASPFVFPLAKPAVGLSETPLIYQITSSVTGSTSKKNKDLLLYWQKMFKENEASGAFEKHPETRFDETRKIGEFKDKYCSDSYSKRDPDYMSLCQ